jgi:hypothetical protein
LFEEVSATETVPLPAELRLLRFMILLPKRRSNYSKLLPGATT